MRLPIRGTYPPNRDALHDQVRAAAGGRCIRCGHPDDAPAIRREGRAGRMPCDERCTHPRDGKQRILTVHHLTGDKSDSRWWNLLSLCQVDHLIIQTKLIPERPYLWSHKPWFRVYAAGFYAWQVGIDISRQQAEAETERWLAVGQPWLYEVER